MAREARSPRRHRAGTMHRHTRAPTKPGRFRRSFTPGLVNRSPNAPVAHPGTGARRSGRRAVVPPSCLACNRLGAGPVSIRNRRGRCRHSAPRRAHVGDDAEAVVDRLRNDRSARDAGGDDHVARAGSRSAESPTPGMALDHACAHRWTPFDIHAPSRPAGLAVTCASSRCRVGRSYPRREPEDRDEGPIRPRPSPPVGAPAARPRRFRRIRMTRGRAGPADDETIASQSCTRFSRLIAVGATRRRRAADGHDRDGPAARWARWSPARRPR